MALIRIHSEMVIHEDTAQAQRNLTKLLDILRLFSINLIKDIPFRLQIPRFSSAVTCPNLS